MLCPACGFLPHNSQIRAMTRLLTEGAAEAANSYSRGILAGLAGPVNV
jgi:hypothetical protein